MIRRLMHALFCVRCAVFVLAGADLLHPFLHAFEGGAIDSALVYAHTWALSVLPIASAPTVPQEG